MSTPTLCIIGAGRAGGSLARHWHAQQSGFTIRALYTRSGAPELANAIDATNLESLANLPPSDALLIASNDQSIAEIAGALAQHSNHLWKGRTVFHLSGAISSDCLNPLAAVGAKVASAHPVRAFSSDRTSFADTWVGLEGNSDALLLLKQAFQAIGGKCFTIDSEHKRKYHAASVIASNHLIALADASYQLWQQAGLDDDTSATLFDSLTRGVLDNLKNAKPAQALTGPIARGDSDTIIAHLEAIHQDAPQIAKLYRHLSEHLLSLELGHSEAQLAELHKALLKR